MSTEEEKESPSLVCYRDGDRYCGADCMAYSTFLPEGPDYQETWAHCKVLVTDHKTAKHLVLIANLLNEKKLEKDKAEQDEKREANNKIPRTGVR